MVPVLYDDYEMFSVSAKAFCKAVYKLHVLYVVKRQEGLSLLTTDKRLLDLEQKMKQMCDYLLEYMKELLASVPGVRGAVNLGHM